jgi:BirA family biotin operon repressor/biotin-[acetyl-CoA-carboxylase] ligase
MSHDAPRAPLDRKRISSEISQYWRVSVVEVTGSTQDDLYQKVTTEVAKNSHNKTLIAAEYQSAGRGRLDRTFEAAPSSALMFSLYVAPKVEKEEWSFLTLLAGLSVQEALASLDSTIAIGVKWPNDLLIGEKKCAGIIAQATDKGVVIGIGINVAMSVEELPVDTATSLSIAGFSNLDRNSILAAIINHFEINLQMWELGDSFIARYKEASVTIGKKVAVTIPAGEVIESEAVGISDTGSLLLSNGIEVTVGDVVHLR